MSVRDQKFQLLFYIPGKGWERVSKGEWVDHDHFLGIYNNMITSGLYPNVKVEVDFENVVQHKIVTIYPRPGYGGREATLIGTYLRWRLLYPNNKNWHYDFTRSQIDPPGYTNIFVWILDPR